MAKKTFQMQGAAGVIALVLAMGVASVRFVGMSDVKDPELRADLAAQLGSDEGQRLLEQLEASKEKGDFTDIVDAFDDPQNSLVLHSVKVSAPLLEWSSIQKVVVRVEYSPRGAGMAGRQVKYLRYLKRAIGPWQYKGTTDPVSYYMNFF